MLLLIAAAAAVPTATQPVKFTASVQATATIRVINAVVLKLDGSPNANAPAPRETTIAAADGSRQPIKVIEFQ